MKVCDLLFTKLNNYANRLIIKKVNTFDDVIDEFNPENAVLEDVNFHQGDGINAEQVVNIDFEDFGFDYLFVAYSDDDSKTIVSRWYVIGKNDNRRGQTNVSLKRDLISDYLDEVVNSPFMMRRGNLDFGKVGDVSETRDPDPFLFQPEGKKYNQVKQSISRLYRFNSKEPSWIVGYIAKNIQGYQTVNIPEVGGLVNLGKIWGVYFNEDNIQKNADDSFDIIAMPYKDCEIRYTDGNNVTHVYKQNANLSLAIMSALAASGLIYDIQLVPYITGLGSSVTIDSDGNIIAEIINFNNANSGFEENHFEPFEYGVYKGNYPGNVQCNYSNLEIKAIIPSDWPVGGTIQEVAFVSDKGASTVSDDNFWVGRTEYSLTNDRYVFPASEYSFDSATGTITFSRPELKNDLFEMMSNGLAHLEITYKYGSNPGNADPVIISLANSKETFHFTVNLPIGVPNLINQDEIKKYSELYVYRLVSPNHNGIFEWSPSMNYHLMRVGAQTTSWSCNVSTYQVAIDLKPFDPYIRVSPDFSGAFSGMVYSTGLYGSNFNDGRGLVCDGDFSLTLPTSAWQNYKLNNKTFASSFSREISTLEKKNAFGIANDVMGAIGSTAGGAVAGGLKGGIPGAIAGAVVGLTTGTYKAIQGGIMRRDAIDKAKADFNMSIQSIQARPDSLTKVSSLDPDNKIWPFLEVYAPTIEDERQFTRKMILTGMIANKETTIHDQMDGVTIVYPLTIGAERFQYFEGTIIRMNDSSATPEMVNEINNELASGVYFNVNNF